MGLHQTELLCTAKETSNKTKTRFTEHGNIFVSDTFHNGLVSKIYKELIQLKTRETNAIKNGQRT